MGASIVCSGIGCVTPFGRSVDTTWAGLLDGRSGLTSLASEERFGARPVGLIDANDLDAIGHRAGTVLITDLVLAAAGEAIANAGLSAPITDARVAIIVGSVSGARPSAEVARDPDRSFRPGQGGPTPDLAPGPLIDRIADAIGRPSIAFTLGTACAAGNQALLLGRQLLSAGAVDLVIAGGADELSEAMLMMFHSFGAFAKEGARPFDRRRDGVSLGEGSGFVVLETLDSARARGHRPLAVLHGGWYGLEGYHMTAQEPDGAGVVTTVQRAIDDAAIDPGQLDLVCAHGTGTPLNDRAEALGLGKLGLAEVPIVSLKGRMGHLQGAASAVEAVCCVNAVVDGRFPANRSDLEIDDELDLVAPTDVVDLPANPTILNLAFGFGGSMAATVIGA